MTGGGRAPAVAHERAEKQDLGLDASSHFAGEGVLHSLTDRRMGWGGLLSSYPSLTSPTGWNDTLFFPSSLLLKLFWGEYVQLHIAIVAPGGVREHTSSEETQGPLVAGHRAR